MKVPLSRPRVASYTLTLGLFLIAFLLCVGSVGAVEKNISLNADVAKNSWYKMRLSNMHQGTRIKIKAEATGLYDVLIVNQEGFKKLPKIKQPLIHSKKLNKHEFVIEVPSSGSYYLVITNQYGNKSKQVALSINASLDEQKIAKIKTAFNKKTEMEAKVSKINASLQGVFIFDDISFHILKCGKGNLFSTNNRVILCAEFVKKIQERVGSKSQIKEVLLFAIIHEVSHILLQQWKYPFFNNEDVVDEMTSVLLKMTNNSKAIKTTAEFFQKAELDKEFQKKKIINDRHPLSIQRARNLLGWETDASLIRRWQPILLPRIETNFLQRLFKSQSEWFGKADIKQELKMRFENSKVRA